MSILEIARKQAEANAAPVVLEYGFKLDAIGRTRVYYDLTARGVFKRYHSRPAVEARLRSMLPRSKVAYLLKHMAFAGDGKNANRTRAVGADK